jgi:hypothetical protein
VVESPGAGSHIGQFSIEEREWDEATRSWRHVKDVAPGGKVGLDDLYVNIPALVQGGLVRPVEGDAPTESTPLPVTTGEQVDVAPTTKAKKV